MNRIACAITAALLLVSPTIVSAGDKEVRQLKSKDVVDPGSDNAYLFYDTLEGKFDVYFLRSLTADELEQYDTNRAEALAEARAKIRDKRDGAPGVSDEELLPDAAFRFSDGEINNLIRMDSGRVYEKNGKHRTYVVEVPPGEYTIYAAGIDGLTSGTCMCMGSVSFDADRGAITDLGAILIAPEDGKTELPELAPYEAPEYIRRKALPYAMTVRPAQADDQVPALFDGKPVVRANYRAADKIPNFMGMLINRMAPVPGVLAYDRDRVVNVSATSQSEAALLDE